DVLYGLHRVCHNECAECRATDYDILPRLPDDLDMAAHGHESADHGTERYDEPDDDRPAKPPPPSRPWPSRPSCFAQPAGPRLRQPVGTRLGAMPAPDCSHPLRTSLRWHGMAYLCYYVRRSGCLRPSAAIS